MVSFVDSQWLVRSDFKEYTPSHLSIKGLAGEMTCVSEGRSLFKISYIFGKNPFVFKKNP